MSQCVPSWDDVEEHQTTNTTTTPKLTLGAHSNIAAALDVPMVDYEVAELTWENGQLAMHGLGPPRVPNKPLPPSSSNSPSKYNTTTASAWEKPRACGTLESIVNQATCVYHPTVNKSPFSAASGGGDELLPWTTTSATMTMDALVPCTNTNEDHCTTCTPLVGCSTRVGSCSGAPTRDQADKHGCRAVARRALAVGTNSEWSGRANHSSASGSASSLFMRGNNNTNNTNSNLVVTMDTGTDMDGPGGREFTSTSLASPGNTSSDVPCTKATATTTADDHDSVCHSKTQKREAEDEVQKKKGNGKSSVSSTKRSRAAAIHNQSERKRRDKINQRMKTLQKLVPNSSKMVIFKSFKEGKLTILSDVKDHEADGTTLDVHDPLIGTHVPRCFNDHHSIHVKSWSETVDYDLTTPAAPEATRLINEALFLKATDHTTDTNLSVVDLILHKIKSKGDLWKTNFKIHGALSFTDLYWEWTEDVLHRNIDKLRANKLYELLEASTLTYDCSLRVVRSFCELWCPTTNTAFTPLGEISISLWDLFSICGLPIQGNFYDEVVPSASELNEKNNNGGFILPMSCRHLFHAYHKIFKRICKEKGKIKKYSNIPAADWISFWYKGTRRYKDPSSDSGKKSINAIKYPREVPVPPLTRSSRECAVFADLGIKNSDIEETYLAAHLACWLCKFVLPHQDMIRPGVFKVASLMAAGKEFCLAIPVLASIYNGLGKVHSFVNRAPIVSFPAHFLYAWMAEHFDTHNGAIDNLIPRMKRYGGVNAIKLFKSSDAARLLTSPNFERMCRFGTMGQRRSRLEDNEQLPSRVREFFVSVRTCNLTLRQGQYTIIKSYNPHRFARQFGYHQRLPGERNSTRRSGLGHLRQEWLTSTLVNSNSSLTLPSLEDIKQLSVTRAYVDWLHSIINQLDADYLSCLVADPSPIEEPSSTMKKRLRSEVVNPLQGKRSKRLVDEPMKESGGNDTNRAVLDNAQNDDLAGTHIHELLSDSESNSNLSYFKQKGRAHSKSNQSPLNNVVHNIQYTNDFFEGIPSSSQPIEADKLQMSIVSINAPLCLDLFEELAQNEANFSSPPPIVEPRRNLVVYRPPSPEASIFCAEKIISRGCPELARRIWNNIKETIQKTPIERLIRHKAGFDTGFEYITKYGFDCSSARTSIESIITKANDYTTMRQDLAIIDVNAYNEQLTIKESSLAAISQRQSEGVAECDLLSKKLKELEAEKARVEAALEKRKAEVSEISTLLETSQLELNELKEAKAKDDDRAGGLKLLLSYLKNDIQELDSLSFDF